MFVFGNLFIALAKITDIALTLMIWMIAIRALISWVNPDPYNPIVQFLRKTTDPILEPIRRFLPHMAIDISPIIAFLLIIFLQQLIVPTLYQIGLNFR